LIFGFGREHKNKNEQEITEYGARLKEKYPGLVLNPRILLKHIKQLSLENKN
jgi:hypothetical protein